ncbi:hypothetical protein HPB50_008490 [Hyalomma asiaticum]|uniref:Uncharacterized protein n=1 Tax=Hyalomma asiaticum TaxID=266040 RepID=A0ACB7SDG8_HYAAI|nr:hypothetical protein HPB50_008490 [Hyalomma asiaticum]
MPGHDVDGEELPAADALDTDGSIWRQVYARSRKPASSLKKTSVVDTSTEEPQKVLASIRRNAPRPPPLPADDYKIVLRIRGGFNCADTLLPKLIHAILQAAALTRSLQDQYRIKAVSNTILVSTPDSERTDAYFQIKTIKMDNRSYEVASHITDPSNTCKGVIRNVPVDHTAETIMSSLLDYDRQGLVLTGRRMGATTSVLVTFRGTRVPYYINYQGGAIRCVPYRYRTEACNLCRTVGHRPDVCPSAPQSLCQVCGVPKPPHDHDCQPKCVVCQKDHPTGSPQCPQRYKPKPKPAPLLFEKDAASLLGPSMLSQNNQRGCSPSPTKRQERRSRSRSRSRRRNRSRSKSVYPDNGRRTGPGNQQWARNIKRGGKELDEACIVCEKHFESRFIERSYKTVVRGELVEIPREAPQLTKDAVPTLFPDAPKYLTKRAPLKRNERDLCNQKPIEHKKRKRQSSTEATDVLSTHVEDSTSDASVAFEFSDLEASPPWTKVNLENCEQQTFACCHTNGDGSLDSLLVPQKADNKHALQKEKDQSNRY